jgi:hypothetical protein
MARVAQAGGLIWLIVCGGSVSAPAQESSLLELEVGKEVTVLNEYAGPMFNEAKCDADGNIYFRRYQEDMFTSPVTKVSRDGKQVTRIPFDAVPGIEGRLTATDFGVSLRGEAFYITRDSKGRVRVVRYAKDGTYNSTTDIGHIRVAIKVAMFSSGQFLVSGTRALGVGYPSAEESFTGVFDFDGSLIRRVSLPGDREKIALDKPTNVESITEHQKEISSQVAVPAEDGNVYLFRPGSPAQIWVVSPKGDVLRSFLPEGPSDKMRARSIKVAGGRIVVQFSESTGDGHVVREIVSLFDASTGERMADYEVPMGLSGMLACYTPDGFIYLGANQQQQLLLKLAPLK